MLLTLPKQQNKPTPEKLESEREEYWARVERAEQMAIKHYEEQRLFAKEHRAIFTIKDIIRETACVGAFSNNYATFYRIQIDGRYWDTSGSYYAHKNGIITVQRSEIEYGKAPFLGGRILYMPDKKFEKPYYTLPFYRMLDEPPSEEELDRKRKIFPIVSVKYEYKDIPILEHMSLHDDETRLMWHITVKDDDKDTIISVPDFRVCGYPKTGRWLLSQPFDIIHGYQWTYKVFDTEKAAKNEILYIRKYLNGKSK